VSAYFIFHNRVNDAPKLQQYIGKAIETLAPYAPEVLVLDESSVVVEGTTNFPRTVVIKFKSREDALRWYYCAEYQAVLPQRLEATEGFAVLVDGFEPPR
jgi:uncharacterized protein (DUF1330 family)